MKDCNALQEHLPGIYHDEVLGLDVGQTWRMRSGDVVTIRAHRINGMFAMVFADDVDCPVKFSVDAYGRTPLTRRDYDLVERVTRVYIAGPMTGYSDLNFPAFTAAAAEYRKRGAFVINPAEINGSNAEMTPEQYREHWVKCMKNDINQLMTCDTIVLLDGWQKSRGAKLGYHIARNLGLTIIYPENN
jgi:hypothetical protein